MNDKETKITFILRNFIDELSRGYGMSEEERETLEKLATEDTTKLYHQEEES
jgi:DNA polymerase III sliding clamp (beta) subunit (PCNA family)